MRILGVSVAHDSSVCLVEDGKVSLFFKEERLTRKKRDKLPYRSLIKILEKVSGKIDAVVFCPVFPNEVFLENAMDVIEKYGHDPQVFNLENAHHLQHASLAFFNSGFEEANIIVVDRNGSDIGGAKECETIFKASVDGPFENLYKNFWVENILGQEKVAEWSRQNNVEAYADSFLGIVKVYESATTAIGEHAFENGKAMGLAAYGKDRLDFPNFFRKNESIATGKNFSHVFHDSGEYQSCYIGASRLNPENFSKDYFQEYADLAFQVQKQTQEAARLLIEKSLEKNNTKNIVITGGYALNVLANSFLVKKFPDLNFYFEPIADDTGNSIGGAMLAYREISNYKKIIAPKNTFFHGEAYSLKEIQGKNVSSEDVARMISKNKSVAIYNGLAEAGPRALGNRSILFNPMNPEAKEVVNRIKKREWYRPFAASVLEEDASTYFEMLNLKSSKNMTISFKATSFAREKFPGIVHVDGSCRIQTVSEGDGPIFDILLYLKKITGHGIVLNTSFNLAGEPLVETPKDALRVLKQSELDAIWFPEISTVLE
jgi:carbamoyltransferase